MAIIKFTNDCIAHGTVKEWRVQDDGLWLEISDEFGVESTIELSWRELRPLIKMGAETFVRIGHLAVLKTDDLMTALESSGALRHIEKRTT